MSDLLRRAPSIRAFDREDTTTILGRDGKMREFQGDSALLVRELLRLLIAPRSMEEILAHFQEVAGGAAEARGSIEQALQLLRDAGAVIAPESVPRAGPRHGGRLVLGISGAVAAAHTPVLVDRLLRRGFDVRVAMTRAARRFVSPDSLRALTHRRVHTSLWAGSAGAPAPHIDLAEWAEVMLVAPATATTLARLARGDCSDAVAATALATCAPVVVAPSMNPAMHDAPAIARNIAQIVDDGFFVVHPAVGVEVADAPADRKPVFGSWPAVDDLVATVEYVWRGALQRNGPLPGADLAARWESTYRETPPDRLPFHTSTLDEDLRSALADAPAGRLWDIGTGLGTVAREAARLGFDALGTDLSPYAIAAATRAGGARFLVDDARESRVEGSFDVIVDRGCFHTLDAPGARAYADTIRQHTRPGSLLVLKIHQDDEPREWHTARHRLADLEALFPFLKTVSWRSSTLPGNVAPPARAWLAIFERRSA